MASLFLGRPVDDPAAPPVAIKVIHQHLSEDWQFLRMFVDEALISVRLRHPNVVRVDELGEQGNVYYLVMEYVHGCSLAQLLTSMARRGRRMRPEIAVWIAQQVAAGLHAAHEMTGHDGALLGVIHRDVSPQNVLLAVDGSVKLLDFGIAKARGRAERTEAGVIKGKIRYMAPEQAMGDAIDRRTDVYALGVVLFEMLTMQRYIEGRNEIEILRKVQAPRPTPPSSRVGGIDRRIDDAVMSAIAPEVAGRPRTAAHLYHALAEAVPEGAAGPVHVAELMRLYALETLEAAARALPPDVALAVGASEAKPTEDERALDEGAREETLTQRMVASNEHESPVASDADLVEEEPTRSEVYAKEHDTSDAPAAQGSDEDEEATLAASEPELSALLDRMREEAKPLSPATSPQHDAVPAPATSAVALPPAPPRPTSRIWWLRVALITLVAFAVGAAASLAWTHFVR